MFAIGQTRLLACRGIPTLPAPVPNGPDRQMGPTPADGYPYLINN